MTTNGLSGLREEVKCHNSNSIELLMSLLSPKKYPKSRNRLLYLLRKFNKSPSEYWVKKLEKEFGVVADFTNLDNGN